MGAIKLTEKLDLLLAEYELNRKQFSERSGIPYMTITNFYEKGTENVKLSTLKKIASFFAISLDYIADDDVTEKINAYIENKKKPPAPDESEAEDDKYHIADRFYSLDSRGQGAVLGTLEHEEAVALEKQPLPATQRKSVS